MLTMSIPFTLETIHSARLSVDDLRMDIAGKPSRI